MAKPACQWAGRAYIGGMKLLRYRSSLILGGALLLALAVLPACTKMKKADAETTAPDPDKPDARVVVTGASFDQLLKESTKPIVLDFWAPWCGPCRKMDPIFAAAAQERPDIIFGKVNVDQEDALANKFGIKGIPTLLIFVEGKMVKQSVGLISKAELLSLLDSTLKKHSKS